MPMSKNNSSNNVWGGPFDFSGDGRSSWEEGVFGLLLILCAFDIDSLILAAVLAVAGLVYTIFVLVGFGEYFLASRANIRLLKKRYRESDRKKN